MKFEIISTYFKVYRLPRSLLACKNKPSFNTCCCIGISGLHNDNILMTFILFFYPILLVVYFGLSSRQFSLAKTQEAWKMEIWERILMNEWIQIQICRKLFSGSTHPRVLTRFPFFRECDFNIKRINIHNTNMFIISSQRKLTAVTKDLTSQCLAIMLLRHGSINSHSSFFLFISLDQNSRKIYNSNSMGHTRNTKRLAISQTSLFHLEIAAIFIKSNVHSISC